MHNDAKPPEPEWGALLNGIKLRVPKFGAKPVSAFVSIPDLTGNGNPAEREPFQIQWTVPQQGLSARVREREDGHLIAEVLCTDAALLNKAAVSVGLGGMMDALPINKVIRLNKPERGGCSGSADLGLLTDVVKELGTQLALIVFLLLEPDAARS